MRKFKGGIIGRMLLAAALFASALSGCDGNSHPSGVTGDSLAGLDAVWVVTYAAGSGGENLTDGNTAFYFERGKMYTGNRQSNGNWRVAEIGTYTDSDITFVIQGGESVSGFSYAVDGNTLKITLFGQLAYECAKKTNQRITIVAI